MTAVVDDARVSETKPAGRILVVDDNPSNLVAIEAALDGLAERVVLAQSGREALHHLLKQEFSLIFLDVLMPSMDGFQTARLIRDRPRTRNIPIIFLTSYNRGERDVLQGYALGAVDFLFKPVVTEILRAKALVFIDLQRRLADAERQTRQIEEEARRLQRDALADADRLKDEFIAMLAHELRNPLAPLVTSLELIRMSGSPQGALFSRLHQTMESQVEHLCRLVDDLLDISRINSGKIELARARTDLVDVVQQGIAMCRGMIEQRRHTLTLELPSDRPAMLADPVRMTQIVANLVHNAARYTPDGGKLRVVGRIEGVEVAIDVEDNGLGIAPQSIDHVFDMYVREGRRPGATKGLGLGLTLVRRLVELHGGTVTARSEGAGRGSQFSVRIPRGNPPDLIVDRTETFSVVTGPPLRVAVIDDNEDIRQTLRDLLEAHGHKVEIAVDGPCGLEMVLEQKPDVALIDIDLPQLDGYGVARGVRAALPVGGPRLVALTGFGQKPDRERALAAGFDAHLVKPATCEVLLRALRGD